MKAIPETRREH